MPAASSDREHDFADVGALVHVGVGTIGFIERIGFLHYRFDLTTLDEWPHLRSKRLGDALLLRHRAWPQRRAGHRQTIEHEGQQVHLGFWTPLQSDLDQPPFSGETLQIPGQIVATDHVENKVESGALGSGLDGFDKIHIAVVERRGTPELLAKPTFGVTPGSRVCLCAEGHGQLNSSRADTAGATVDQKSLAGTERATIKNIGPNSEKRLWQRGCLGHRQALRHFETQWRCGDTVLGVSTSGDQCTDVAANQPSTGLIGGGHDLTGNLQTGNIRRPWWRRIHSLALHDVGSIHARRRHLDQHFANPGRWHLPVDRLEHMWIAGRGDFDSGHGGRYIGHGWTLGGYQRPGSLSNPTIASYASHPRPTKTAGHMSLGNQQSKPPSGQLLSATEPHPYHICNPDAGSSIVLTCDHASSRIPSSLANLGLPPDILETHVGWDIGAAEVAARLATTLDAVLIASNYSRLVIDINRQPGHPDSIAERSEHVVVPGNQNVQDSDRQRRQAEVFEPYHQALGALIQGKMDRGHEPAVVSLHSFTPVYHNEQRPWHIGVLWDTHRDVARALIGELSRDGTCVGDNQPYDARDAVGFTTLHHAGHKGLTNVLIEIRQDLIETETGVEQWADRLQIALQTVLREHTHG